MSGGIALLQTLSPFQQAGCGQGPAVAIEGLVPEEEEEVVLPITACKAPKMWKPSSSTSRVRSPDG